MIQRDANQHIVYSGKDLLLISAVVFSMIVFLCVAFDVLVQPADKEKAEFMHRCVVVSDKSEWRCDELWKWRN